VQNKANLEAWPASGNPSYRTNPIRWAQMRKTNPIGAVGGGPGGPDVRNEPNLPIADWGQAYGGTPRGVASPARAGRWYKRTQFRRSSGPHDSDIPVSGVNRAKRTQLPEAGHRGGVSIADFGLRISDCGLGTDLWQGDESCKTNPIRPIGWSSGGPNAQNEPKRQWAVVGGQ
jgi:hypothetical protein